MWTAFMLRKYFESIPTDILPKLRRKVARLNWSCQRNRRFTSLSRNNLVSDRRNFLLKTMLFILEVLEFRWKFSVLNAFIC